MQVYLARNNVQAGPYSVEQLNSMLASGEVLQNDLIWHQGMDEWKTIAEVTQGKINYYPDGFVPTVTTQLERQERSRITVDELYGNKPTQQTEAPHKVAHIPTQSQRSTSRARKGNTKSSTTELASPVTRIFATLIDNFILTATFAPIFLSVGQDKFSAALTSSTNTMEQAQALSELIPSHTMTMTMIFMLAILFAQTMLLIRRGQTLGKLVTGIRVLDKKTKKLPSVTNIILIRAIITNIVYGLPFGIIFIAIDLIAMFVDNNKQSIHDKLAKTIVVKASDEQLDK